MKQKLIHAVTAAVLSGACAAAHAAPMIGISIDDAAPITCADNAACDLSSVLGVVHFNYTGGDFAINATTGISKPIHTTGSPLMHLDTVNLQVSGGPHRLRIKLSDTDFAFRGPFTATYAASLSGTNPGATYSYLAYYSAANDPDIASGIIGSTGALGAGVSSGTLADGWAPDGLYSVSQVVSLITRDGVTNFSGNFEVNVPEPTTLALLGVGLIGFAAVRRRRQAS